jgi:microcystin-dependent protein
MMKRLHAIATGLTAAALLAGAPSMATAQTTPYLGDIIVVGFDFCPRSYALADGALISIASNSALFALYGTYYGGDGVSTFALPDLRGRVPVSFGRGPGQPQFDIGEKFGTETNTMTAGTMPVHSHQARGTIDPPTEETPVNHVLGTFPGTQGIYSTGTPDAPMGGNTVSHTGSGIPFNNMAPTLTLRYCVATQGIFPSRS